jgi:DNA-directed RNA polymerase specialized sigma24 family protein
MARRAARRFAEPKKMYANALDGDDFQAVIFAKLVKARESVQRAKVENETYYLWTVARNAAISLARSELRARKRREREVSECRLGFDILGGCESLENPSDTRIEDRIDARRELMRICESATDEEARLLNALVLARGNISAVHRMLGEDESEVDLRARVERSRKNWRNLVFQKQDS